MVDFLLLKAFFKGLMTYIPGVTQLIERKNLETEHSAASAEFCYSMWLSILVHLRENGVNSKLIKICELGNGGSFGIGLCALLTGSEKYYSFEIRRLNKTVLNLKIVDDLVLLLKNSTPISGRFKQINLSIIDNRFPNNLITPKYLDENYVSELKQDIKNCFVGSKNIEVVENWIKRKTLDLDLIFSRAVMEHVSNPDHIYSGLESHLKDDGYMFHDIELHSHGITRSLDGHYSIPRFLWKVIFGTRKFFLNRWDFGQHITSIIMNNFDVLTTQENTWTRQDIKKKILIGATVLAIKHRHSKL